MVTGGVKPNRIASKMYIKKEVGSLISTQAD